MSPAPRKTVRQYFVTGLLALLPAGITIYIAYVIIAFVDSIVGVILPVNIPGLGLVVALLIITGFGVLVDHLAGQYLIDVLDRSLRRIPILRGIYDASKQIVSTIFDKNASAFKRVVEVPFPVGGSGSVLAFVVQEATADGRVGVFVPFSPPTAGLLLFYDPSSVRSTGLSVEQAMRILLSGGTLLSERVGDRSRAQAPGGGSSAWSAKRM